MKALLIGTEKALSLVKNFDKEQIADIFIALVNVAENDALTDCGFSSGLNYAYESLAQDMLHNNENYQKKLAQTAERQKRYRESVSNASGALVTQRNADTALVTHSNAGIEENRKEEKRKEEKRIEENREEESVREEGSATDVASRSSARTARFTPPSLDDVRSYIHEKNYAVDAESFVAFYASKDWMIGKNKMKDWKQALVTWNNRNKQGIKANPLPHALADDYCLQMDEVPQVIPCSN